MEVEYVHFYLEYPVPLKFELLSISQCHASILRTHGEKKMIGKRDESMIVFSLKAKHFYGGDITTSFHTRGNKHFFLLLVYCRFHRCWAVVGHHCYIMSELMKKLQAMKMSSPFFCCCLAPCGCLMMFWNWPVQLKGFCDL